MALLREQIRDLTQARNDDQETLKQVLDQLAKLAAAQRSQDNLIRSEERDDISTTGFQGRTRYSKKLPDPPELSEGDNPTYESWKLQMQGKFRVNTDHFEDEEARMLYLFGRTTGFPSSTPPR